MAPESGADLDPRGVRELRERVRALRERCAELEIERDAARAANAARSRFLAQLSHEIRTPLDAVIGLTDAVLRENPEEAQHQRLIEVLLSAETLLGVVNDLLDYARIEVGEHELERVPFDLHDAIFETLGEFSRAAEARGLELAGGVDPAIPPLLIGDPGRLRHVLAVLLRNAVRFTERGEVGVRVGLGSGDDQLMLEVEVRDTGVGIAHERIPGLFEASAAVAADEARGPAAITGLPLCRKLVERMGGELRVESVPGGGSTFSFSARVEVTDGVHDRHRPAPRPLRGIRALLAVHHPDTAGLLVETMDSWGMRSSVATTAKDALDRLGEAAREGEPVELLIADARLPATGGIELVAQLRGDPRFEAVTVLLLHATARPASPELARRLSIAAQIPKPVHPARLFEAAMEALEIPQPPTPPRYRYRSARDPIRLGGRAPALSTSPAWVPPSRILVVDDSPASLGVIRAILDDRGHTIEAVSGGRQALERFHSGRFDVVLLDLQMPGMDGFEVCAAIRAREAGSGHRVPIVAMTANALRGDRERCLVAGMDQFITKPVRRGEFFAALLEARQHGVGATLEDAAPPAERAAVDWTAMVAMVDGNRELLREVVSAYEVEIREHLERFPVELASRDIAEARRRAHSLHGAMGVFRCADAEAAAGRLEAAIAAGELESAATLFASVRHQVSEVLPQLEAFLGRSSGADG